MKWEVSSRVVLQNLSDLRENFRGGDRTYPVLLNCKTGEMRLERKISAIRFTFQDFLNPGEWREVSLIVKGIHFHLDFPEMNVNARKIAEETLEFLNDRAKEVAVISEIFQKMPHVRSGVRESISDMMGWMGQIDRLEAERRLEGKPVGTYLLREGDSLDKQIAFNLSKENGMKAVPYLLTVVEEDEKVVDYLLLETSYGWTVYKDDPILASYSFSTLRELVFTLARRPI